MHPLYISLHTVSYIQKSVNWIQVCLGLFFFLNQLIFIIMLEVSVGKVLFSDINYKRERDSVFTGNRIFNKEDKSEFSFIYIYKFIPK